MKVVTPVGIGRTNDLVGDPLQVVLLDRTVKKFLRGSVFPISNFGIVRIIDLGIRNSWRSGYLFNLSFEYSSVLDSEVFYKHQIIPINEVMLIHNFKTGIIRIISSGRNTIFSEHLDKITILPPINKWEETRVFDYESLNDSMLRSIIKDGIYAKISLSLKKRKIISFTIFSSESDGAILHKVF